MTKHVVRLFTLLLTCSCTSPGDVSTDEQAALREAEPSRDGSRTGRTEHLARPCRADAFYVEVPLQLSPNWTNNGFVDDLSADLRAAANAVGAPWFCGADEITCPAGTIAARVETVLPQRTAPAYRADGHLRFYRVRYIDEASGELLSVRPGAQCDAVATLRSAFIGASGSDPDSIFVGRECDAVALDIQQSATAEMLSWHLDRMGAASVAGQPNAGLVDVALVDSGVVAGLHAELGVQSETSYVNDPLLHVHGTAMAALIDQLAADAHIHSHRVIAGDATTPGAALARAVERAVFATTPGRPLVVNLSLGFPNELGRHAALTGDASCVTHEDPFGESLRYALYMARRLEADGRHIFVSAAAGNQPMDPDSSLFPAPTYPVVELLPCSMQTVATTPWFYPGWWSHLDSCMDGDPTNRRLAFGVTVIDDRNAPSIVTAHGGEGPLVAPGQHVYASHSAAPMGPSGPWCASSPPTPWQPHLPAALTGTSVGAALVTAAAARIQSARVASGAAPLASPAIERLLYLTGVPLNRMTADGLEVRLLSFARLDRVLEVRDCSEVIACASSGNGLAGVLAACQPALDTCGIGLGNVPTGGAVSWPLGYTEEGFCGKELSVTTLYDADMCGSSCPTATAPPRDFLGSIGPSPDTPTCPDCALYFSAAKPGLVAIEMSPMFPQGTTFSGQYLTVRGYNYSWTKKVYYVWLQGAPSQPGGAATLSVPTHQMDLNWKTASATFTTTINSPQAQSPSTDVSALRLLPL